ncbi:hypothetical protein AVV29_gp127 [Vibrio phage phi 3]|uniref:Uncharacterized protein n=1 Tax=Vibrio phage phi 3 TaxID=1589298 RepID=A0A0B5GYS0_9CAUD|nr:hypothetical protein AVV29_gp127 [Vibrio phage phi 3]AJF40851.1 hypothetical protein SBVP3_0084 [Vibrio phage phi 3]
MNIEALKNRIWAEPHITRLIHTATLKDEQIKEIIQLCDSLGIGYVVKFDNIVLNPLTMLNTAKDARGNNNE